MLWLSDTVIETVRQGIPVVSAIVGAGIGAERSARKGKGGWARVAAWGGLGWFAGYVVRSMTLRLMEGSRQSLPQATAPMPDAIPAEPPMNTMGPTAGLYTPPSTPAGEVEAMPAPPPVDTTPPIMKASGEVISIQGSMDSSAMGSVYGA